jgi:chaperone required for assembly of F1-ATPase
MPGRLDSAVLTVPKAVDAMRELFEDILQGEPINPMEAARRAMRQPLRKRFFSTAHVEQHENEFRVLLDGRPVRTPARRVLACPNRKLADLVAAEWQAQVDVIDPGQMPFTRLANTVIDGVAAAKADVAAEIAKYIASDLLFYRAAEPEGLVARQNEQWGPILAWACEALGAGFVSAQGITFVRQPVEAVEAARGAIPSDPWRLGAIHVITTLTGSALIAFALAAGALTPEAAWTAAHVDEDWNMERWGHDQMALARRLAQFAELQTAATVLCACSENSRS